MISLKPSHIEEGFRHTEDKAKVVAVVWGTEFIQFLAALTIFHQGDFKYRKNSSISSYHPGAIHLFLHIILVQNGWRDKESNKFCPPQWQGRPSV